MAWIPTVTPEILAVLELPGSEDWTAACFPAANREKQESGIWCLCVFSPPCLDIREPVPHASFLWCPKKLCYRLKKYCHNCQERKLSSCVSDAKIMRKGYIEVEENWIAVEEALQQGKWNGFFFTVVLNFDAYAFATAAGRGPHDWISWNFLSAAVPYFCLMKSYVVVRGIQAFWRTQNKVPVVCAP